jgi:hypothetical protein
LREEFVRAGIVFPDFLWPVDQQRPDEDRKGYWLRTIRDLRPGVSELFIHASLATDDMKRMTGDLGMAVGRSAPRNTSSLGGIPTFARRSRRPA